MNINGIRFSIKIFKNNCYSKILNLIKKLMKINIYFKKEISIVLNITINKLFKDN